MQCRRVMPDTKRDMVGWPFPCPPSHPARDIERVVGSVGEAQTPLHVR
jgi:hypothetical protein